MSRKIDNRTIATARKMRSQGISRQEIARALRVSVPWVGKILRNSS